MRIFITHSLRVERHDFERRATRPYICLEQVTEQHLVKSTMIFGVPVFKRVIDREEVPQHALISLGALGYSDWKSKFADQIDKDRAANRAAPQMA